MARSFHEVNFMWETSRGDEAFCNDKQYFINKGPLEGGGGGGGGCEQTVDISD